nr:hypothetical protein [Aeromonas schubertii]
MLGQSSSTLTLKGDVLSLSFGTQTFDVPSLGEGSIGGVLDYRREVLRPAKAELNQIASKLADEFNVKQQGAWTWPVTRASPCSPMTRPIRPPP